MAEITNLAIAQKEKSQLEVTKALEEVKIAQVKTRVIEIGAREILASETKEVLEEEKIKETKPEEIIIEDKRILSKKRSNSWF